jgi:tetratricopeptide (TPR) repeat protein
MYKISNESLKNYEELMRKDPSSRAFAPLAEAYRERGNLSQAERLARSGIKKNPTYSAGFTLLARVLMDLERPFEAIEILEKAIDLDPQNLLGFQLLGTCRLILGETKEALRSFKMVLFLNPQHEKAKMAVTKLEGITALDYEEDIFEYGPNKSTVFSEPNLDQRLEKSLSMFDAMVLRGNFEKAKNILAFLKPLFPNNIEIETREHGLKRRSFTSPERPAIPAKQKKLAKLQTLLASVQKLSQQENQT